MNIVGDKSSGKTLQAIEAMANFANTYADGELKYQEAESAFDIPYAQALGAPIDRIDFGTRLDTVEQFYDDLVAFCAGCKKRKHPGLYILDSLDALSDEDEMERDIRKGTFGAAKAKLLSEIFRKLVREIEESKVTLIIISQVRENIGVMIGEKYTRSGGKALDFYASQVVWFAQIKKLEKEREGVKRRIGVQIKAVCKKNKVGLPYRECEYPIIFGYGVDDFTAGIQWLSSIGRLEEFGIETKDGAAVKYLNSIKNLPADEYNQLRTDLNKTVKRVWSDIEKKFLPERSKYGDQA